MSSAPSRGSPVPGSGDGPVTRRGAGGADESPSPAPTDGRTPHGLLVTVRASGSWRIEASYLGGRKSARHGSLAWWHPLFGMGRHSSVATAGWWSLSGHRRTSSECIRGGPRLYAAAGDGPSPEGGDWSDLWGWPTGVGRTNPMGRRRRHWRGFHGIGVGFLRDDGHLSAGAGYWRLRRGLAIGQRAQPQATPKAKKPNSERAGRRRAIGGRLG